MRFLIILVTVLAALYGGYWFVGRSAVQNGAEGFLEGLTQDGWTVNHAGVTTRGFPSRFDTTVTDLSLTDPVSGIGWVVPYFQIFALSYRPNDVIAVWPEEQVIVLPNDRLTITADGLRASAGVDIGMALPLDQVTVASGPMQIASEHGWDVALERLLFAFRDGGPGLSDYDLFMESEGIAPPTEIRSLIDPGASLPERIDVFRLDAAVTLGQPLDRHMTEAVQLRAVHLRDLRLTWGDLDFSGNGRVTIAADGTPEGQIMLVAQNWRQMIGLGVAAGVVSPGIAPMIERAAGLLAGGTDTLTAPLNFQDGFMSLGPIPLGPAPKFN